MTFQQTLAFITFVTMASMCCGHIGGGISFQDVNPQVYCGRSLARALALLCFDEGGYDKRSEAYEPKGTMYGQFFLPYLKDQEAQLGLPWMSSNKARSMSLPSRGKRYPGVVNECCDKPCSINELLTYC
ncbi:unnamed protein product [Parnassius mnemosyne]|uniref:Insulin-like domain-containing protein n=1 Tax=Parnassius mnemosyne TaxID=213953 RepID=A0AAV1K4Q3_9NEOP